MYSTDESPVQYNAFDKDLQLWVAACLYKGAVDVYRIFVGEMDDETAERHYAEGMALGTTLQVPRRCGRPTGRHSTRTGSESLDKVHIDDTVREYLYPIAAGPDARGEAARAAAALVGALRPADHDGLSAATISRRDAAAVGLRAPAQIRPADGRHSRASTTSMPRFIRQFPFNVVLEGPRPADQDRPSPGVVSSAGPVALA